jgi:hypothetical protein
LAEVLQVFGWQGLQEAGDRGGHLLAETFVGQAVQVVGQVADGSRGEDEAELLGRLVQEVGRRLLAVRVRMLGEAVARPEAVHLAGVGEGREDPGVPSIFFASSSRSSRPWRVVAAASRVRM